jgi:hypothetical protein
METLQDFVKFVEEHQTYCCSCQEPVWDITYYGPHNGGLWIAPPSLSGREKNIKVWAYLHCPSCNYDTAFWKVEQQNAPREGVKITPRIIEENFGDRQEKPWRGICCKACWYAKGPISDCVCRCGGENHRRGRQPSQIELPFQDQAGEEAYREAKSDVYDVIYDMRRNQ